jgi:hypothetical protein
MHHEHCSVSVCKSLRTIKIRQLPELFVNVASVNIRQCRQKIQEFRFCTKVDVYRSEIGTIADNFSNTLIDTHAAISAGLNTTMIRPLDGTRPWSSSVYGLHYGIYQSVD